MTVTDPHLALPPSSPPWSCSLFLQSLCNPLYMWLGSSGYVCVIPQDRHNSLPLKCGNLRGREQNGHKWEWRQGHWAFLWWVGRVARSLPVLLLRVSSCMVRDGSRQPSLSCPRTSKSFSPNMWNTPGTIFQSIVVWSTITPNSYSFEKICTCSPHGFRNLLCVLTWCNFITWHNSNYWPSESESTDFCSSSELFNYVLPFTLCSYNPSAQDPSGSRLHNSHLFSHNFLAIHLFQEPHSYKWLDLPACSLFMSVHFLCSPVIQICYCN